MLAWVAAATSRTTKTRCEKRCAGGALLAAGGDPHRELALDGRAVTALAADLDSPEPARRAHARDRRLVGWRRGCRGVARRALRLAASPESAWRAYVCGILAAELAEED
jgi:hypothetical protein